MLNKSKTHNIYNVPYGKLLILAVAWLTASVANAQVGRISQNGQNFETSQDLENEDGENEERERTVWGRDSTKHQKSKPIPKGQFQWVLEPRLGTVVDAANKDTVVHNFQNWNNTDGYRGNYSYLANLGAPRLNRLYMEREITDDFLFLQPLDYFRTGLSDFRFTNTLSPITNLAYHSCGTKQNGEDRIRAYFASNINHITGIGFKCDYLYGRGYYMNSANSMFGITGYGYHRGERYNIHAYLSLNKMKNYENGGIENDDYIENPQIYPQSYKSTEIPVMLADVWNRNKEQKFYLTHKYNIGYSKEVVVPDSLKPQPPSHSELLEALPDSIRLALRTDSVAKAHTVDSLLQIWQAQQVPPTEFIPVASVSHTFDLANLNHTYIAHSDPGNYYTNHYYGDAANVYDMTRAMSIRNTVGLSMREGFNKWAQMGITLFATHKLRSYTLLKEDRLNQKRYNENDVSVGGEIARTQGKLLHFNVNGEFWLIGPNIGDFNVNGRTTLDFKLGKRDSLEMDVKANIRNVKPDFFFRHYHSQYAWWDNDDLSREFHTKVEGSLRLKKMGTRLKVGFENITNYTHLAMVKTRIDPENTATSLPTDFSNAVEVRQAGSNIQVFSAGISQDLKFGPVHWDSEVTYQKTSSDDILPLPQLNVYTNLYLLFHIAKVLRVQLGGDMRYYTLYYAPEWSPNMQQFAVQDTNQEREKVGNYPIVNVYANLHLKHCRLYCAVNHVNAGTGRSYMSPHYPLNPLTIHFGISWNFFN